MHEVIFGYSKYASVTQALFETGVPSFDTVLHNAQSVFCSKWTSCNNSLVCSEGVHYKLIVGVTRPSHFCLSVLGFCPCPVFLFIWAMLPAIKRSFVISSRVYAGWFTPPSCR